MRGISVKAGLVIMEDWGSQSIQVVWFVQSLENIKADSLFELITGGEPDNVQRNRIPGPLNPFFGVANGVIDSREYQIQIQPARVDLIISPSPVTEDTGHDFRLMATKETLDILLSRFEAVAEHLPPSVRLSLITNLAKPAADQTSAVASVLNMSGLNLPFGDVSDPILQLNRRKALSHGVIINRIVRFSVGAYQQFVMQFDQTQGAPLPVTAQSFASALTLDFNTVPDGRIFKGTDQLTTFKEIISETLKFAEIRSPQALAE